MCITFSQSYIILYYILVDCPSRVSLCRYHPGSKTPILIMRVHKIFGPRMNCDACVYMCVTLWFSEGVA